MTTHIGVVPLPLCQFLSYFPSNHEIDRLECCVSPQKVTERVVPASESTTSCLRLPHPRTGPFPYPLPLTYHLLNGMQQYQRYFFLTVLMLVARRMPVSGGSWKCKAYRRQTSGLGSSQKVKLFQVSLV